MLPYKIRKIWMSEEKIIEEEAYHEECLKYAAARGKERAARKYEVKK